MITDEQARKIAKLVHLSEDEFLEKLKSDKEETIDIPDGLTVLDDKALTELKNKEYKTGTEKGVEMAVKEIKTAKGWDFPGKKLEDLVEHSGKAAVAEAKISPDKQVDTLKQDLAKVREEYSTLEKQLQEKDGAVTKATTDREIFKQLPTLGEKALPVDKLVSLMRADGYDFKMEGNTLVTFKGEDAVKDKLSNYAPFKDVALQYATENNIPMGIGGGDDPIKGRGGKDGDPPPAFTKLSEVQKHYTDNKKSTQGQEYMNHVKQLKAENPDFDLNS